MTHGSLFSGIGGFDLAAQWMGWENKFHCEWNEFGQKILKYYWPRAQSYEDITKTDFTIWRGKIDIITGGFPCQPYSVAGKRLGKEDERHLWPEMLRAIREVKPSWVVGENVYGLLNWSEGLVFEEVQADLEKEGYTVQPVILSACSVNAPHKRERIWFIAHRTNSGFKSVQRKRKYGVYGFEIIANSSSNGHQLRRFGKNRQTESQSQRIKNKREWFWDDNRRNGKQKSSTYSTKPNKQRDRLCEKQQKGKVRGSNSILVTNTTNERLEGRNKQRRSGRTGQKIRTKAFCIPRGWETFPTQPPICGGNDGLPRKLDGITFPKWRNESINGYGNAIVPQVAYEFLKAIEKTNDTIHP